MTDEQLMLAYQAGDYSAFETLYARHSAKVYGYLRRKLSSAEEADEVFQKTFLKAHRSRAAYDPRYPFTQWLFVIAQSSALDHFRKHQRQVATTPLSEFGDVFAAELSQTEGSPTFKGEKELTILEDLPPDQRKALEMRIIHESSYEEIARSLQKTQDSVRQLVSRALKKLRAGS